MFVVCCKLTVEGGVHFYTIVSFYSVLHTLEHFSRVLQKPLRFNVIRVDHSARQYTFKRSVDLLSDERSFVAIRVLATCVSVTNVYETSL